MVLISYCRKVFNIDPEDLPSASKAEERSIFCQPYKRAEEFRKADVYCKKCETKFCSDHQKVCNVYNASIWNFRFDMFLSKELDSNSL